MGKYKPVKSEELLDRIVERIYKCNLVKEDSEFYRRREIMREMEKMKENVDPRPIKLTLNHECVYLIFLLSEMNRVLSSNSMTPPKDTQSSSDPSDEQRSRSDSL